jgi:hypothetical protein
VVTQFTHCTDVYDAGDKVCDFINALDTEGMTPDKVRSEVYRYALRLRPVQRPLHHQSRIDSFAEALTNTAIGFLVSLVTWIVVARMYGIPMLASTSLSITAIFTVVSIARQYVLRRIFDGRSPWQAIKACMSRVSRYG